MNTTYDAVVVGSGPNGLSAAIAIAQKGRKVLVVEAADTIGGGTRSAPLTLPGFVHDVCSAIHPMAIGSPFWKTLPLAEHGLEWIQPEVPFAHPLDDGTAAAKFRSVEETAQRLGRDADAYRRLMTPLVEGASGLFDDLLGPPRPPRHLLTVARFGLNALYSGKGLADKWFSTTAARALISGLAVHAVLPLDRIPGAAITLMLGIAGRAVELAVPARRRRSSPMRLASYFRTLGGEIQTGHRVTNVDELPPGACGAVRPVTETSARRPQGTSCRSDTASRWRRYRATDRVSSKSIGLLAGPIPCGKASECRRAGTVSYVGGTLEEIAEAELAPVEKAARGAAVSYW